jgi:hypothetical protein
MKAARDAGEPISKGRVNRRAIEARQLRSALLGVALVAGIVLINAVLAILFIALIQSLGLFASAASEAADLSALGSAEMVIGPARRRGVVAG